MGKVVSEGADLQPEVQLEMFATELARQREENARRRGGMHRRAGVRSAAAGITGRACH